MVQCVFHFPMPVTYLFVNNLQKDPLHLGFDYLQLCNAIYVISVQKSLFVKESITSLNNSHYFVMK